jgi:hypothetical protein
MRKTDNSDQQIDRDGDENKASKSIADKHIVSTESDDEIIPEDSAGNTAEKNQNEAAAKGATTASTETAIAALQKRDSTECISSERSATRNDNNADHCTIVALNESTTEISTTIGAPSSTTTTAAVTEWTDAPLSSSSKDNALAEDRDKDTEEKKESEQSLILL